MKVPEEPTLRILVDLDNVLCDTEEHFVTKWRKYNPEDEVVKPENRRSFYMNGDYEKLGIKNVAVSDLYL